MDGTLLSYSQNKQFRHLYQMFGHFKVLEKDGAQHNQEEIT